MTFIAFTTNGQRAEIVTDSLNYTTGASEIGEVGNKAVCVSDDVVAVTQGDETFAAGWAELARSLADNPDRFPERAETHLPALWAERVGLEQMTAPEPSVAFALVYNRSGQRFEAYGWSSLMGFEHVPLEGVYVMPAPFDARPGYFEDDEYARTLMAAVAAGQVAREDAEQSLTYRRSRPEIPAPSSRAGWVDLVRRVHASRALEPLAACKVIIGGDIHRTTLAPGRPATTEVIYRFPTEGDQWQAMIAGTLHPDAQRALCRCGSGAVSVSCCLPSDLGLGDGGPCPCRSGQTFEDCCQIDVAQPALAGA